MMPAPTWTNSESKTPPDLTPYVHWWKHAMLGGGRPAGTRNPVLESLVRGDTDKAGSRAQGSMAIAGTEYSGGHDIPMPKGSVSPDLAKFTKWGSVNPRHFDDIDLDTVIVGVIDSGISPGNHRFRLASGKTRFLAAWQQTAKWKRQRFLPFGAELYQKRIDNLIKDHTINGRLDEDAFNRCAGLVAPLSPFGQRELDYRAAHGTHVLDLAAGYGDSDSDDLKDRIRIIAVNLPSQSLHGSAGFFLGIFAILAIERIVALADAIWEAKCREKWESQGRIGATGFPIVVNLSYGMQAGPKDGQSSFENAIRRIIQGRAGDNKSPVCITLPAGNENLHRGAARWYMGNDTAMNGRLPAATSVRIPWRIKPSDQTTNFVEIWTDRMDCPDPTAAPRVTLRVTPPGQASSLQVPQLRPGHFADLGNFARVYVEHHERSSDNGSVCRYRFIICTAPTLSWDRDAPVAPAGLWMIEVGYEGTPMHMFFHVQSDQSGTPHGNTGLLSYFDHPSYRTHTEDGRLCDTFSYPNGDSMERDIDANGVETPHGPVWRKGSQNALATPQNAITIGGYRISDGRPAIYSSSTDGRRVQGTRATITALYPSEDGPAHFGLLAAGSKSGSVVAMRGTSMSSALAARDMAFCYLAWHDGGRQPMTATQVLAYPATLSVTGSYYLPYPTLDTTDPKGPRLKVGDGRARRPGRSTAVPRRSPYD